jgi:hypothetical protein
MMLSVTKVINDIGQRAFHAMLLAGAFPEVKFSKNGMFSSYSLFEYSEKWSTFMKVLDWHIKDTGLDKELGVFSRKRNAKFLEHVEELANKITPEDVVLQPVRFKTWVDRL